MNLNDMSAQFSEKKGKAFGFGVKSLKTKKSFIAIGKSGVDGKIILQAVGDAKALFLVSGTEDRYAFADATMAGGTTARNASEVRRGEINARITEIKARQTAIETQLEGVTALEEENDDLTVELDDLEDELADLEE